MKSFFILFSGILLTTACSIKQDEHTGKSKNAPKFDCDKALLAKIIDKKPDFLDNGAKLYWDYSCDSSWLTFENRYHQKKILYSLPKEVIELTHRLGHSEFIEFSTTFLYKSRTISGCCIPEDYYSYDKNSGELISYLGRAIFVSADKELPFVLSIFNNGSDTTLRKNYNKLRLVNIETKKEFYIQIPGDSIQKGMKNNNYMIPEDVFSAELNGNHLIIAYHTDKYVRGKYLKESIIEIDLDKYLN